MTNPTRTFSTKQEYSMESQSREIMISLDPNLLMEIKVRSGSCLVVIDLTDATTYETTSIELSGRSSLEKIMNLIAFAIEG